MEINSRKHSVIIIQIVILKIISQAFSSSKQYNNM